MFYEVALPVPLTSSFCYSFEQDLEIGIRVRVPFGKRTLIGVVIDKKETAPNQGYEIKSITEALDEIPAYSSNLMKLANWMSSYYFHPLGEVLKTMLPASSVRLQRKSGTHINVRSIGNEENENENKTLNDDSNLSTSVPPEPTEEQKLVLDELYGAIDNEDTDNKPYLLFGVTGSGKTEVYLRLIEKVLTKYAGQEPSPQVLVLVPEISLTPQMTRVFESRFASKVTVVHSGMTDTARWKSLQKIRSGTSQILIGARSAVFAPFSNLKLILVDEEHDTSYKQGSGLLYNARDVAVVRSKIDNACIVLGSATPSLESFNNAELGKYNLLKLTKRATGSLLPEVQLIQTKAAYKKGVLLNSETNLNSIETRDQTIPISEDIIDALKQNFENQKQAIVVVNRRGYAYYLLSMQQGKAVQCPHCSISLSLHRKTKILHCHYCDYTISTTKLLQMYPADRFIMIGYGSEKIESYLSKKIPEANIFRLDSDTTSQRGVLEESLSQFKEGKIDILVGTQILAKGHDFPKVTLMVILEVDELLDFPDFRAGERTFQLMVQASGRAGRGDYPGKVLLQTQRKDHPIIAYALQHNYPEFANRELQFRKGFNYPPYCKICLIELTSVNKLKLTDTSKQIEKWMGNLATQNPELTKLIKVIGPITPPVETIRQKHRRTVLVSSGNINALRFFVDRFREKFMSVNNPYLKIKIDVDPQSLF